MIDLIQHLGYEYEPPREPRYSFQSAVMISQYPGAYKLQDKISKQLTSGCVKVSMISPESSNIDTERTLISSPDWIFMSAPDEFSAQIVNRFIDGNKKPRLGCLEQTEGDASRVLEGLQKRGISPNLITNCF